MNFEDVLFTVKDKVCTISINRPATLNAIRGITISELETAFRLANDRSDIGIVVLTGEGDRAFSSGGDMHWEKEGGLEHLEWNLDRLILQCMKPTIARVNGYAIASGNHMAYYCDFTIAADHAVFGQNGPRIGAPAAGYPVSHSANILGHKRAREMWMLCRRYTAQQMLEWGLVNAVVPKEKLDDEVKRWCDELLLLSPTCLKTVKASFNALVDLTQPTEIVRRVAPTYFETGEQQEGINAFFEKRPPDFDPWR